MHLNLTMIDKVLLYLLIYILGVFNTRIMNMALWKWTLLLVFKTVQMEILASGHLTKSSLCDYGKVVFIMALGESRFWYFSFWIADKTDFTQLTRAGMFRVIWWSSSNIYWNAWFEILRWSGCSKCNIEEGILR